MKVYRVTVAVDPDGVPLEAGVLFSTGTASGRIPIILPPQLVADVIAAAQAALDTSAAELTEVPPEAVTTALHRVRSATQDTELARREHERVLEEIKAKRAERDAVDMEIRVKQAQLAAERTKL